jgi:hypothetical protein
MQQQQQQQQQRHLLAGTVAEALVLVACRCQVR